MGTRPGEALWDLIYDVVLYNVVYVAGAVVAWQSARRAPAKRHAWRALALALLLNTVANLWYSLVLAGQETVPVPSLADALAAVAISVALLLAPALQVAGVDAAEYVTNLAYPVADVLLLAVVVAVAVAVAAILGIRGDRTLI